MPKTYHVALLKGTGRNANRVTVELRESIDSLDCETWRYLGQRLTTKAHYRRNKAAILRTVNEQEGTQFTRILID